MLDNITKDQIIALRAKGWSFERIAKELGISASTAYDWASKSKAQIDKFRALQLEAIQERVLADFETELSLLADELKRVQAELRGRDYGYVNTDQLFWYQNALLAKIDRKRVPLPDLDAPADSLGETQNRMKPNKTE